MKLVIAAVLAAAILVATGVVMAVYGVGLGFGILGFMVLGAALAALTHQAWLPLLQEEKDPLTDLLNTTVRRVPEVLANRDRRRDEDLSKQDVLDLLAGNRRRSSAKDRARRRGR